jgi:hypothetical protein
MITFVGAFVLYVLIGVVIVRVYAILHPEGLDDDVALAAGAVLLWPWVIIAVLMHLLGRVVLSGIQERK